MSPQKYYQIAECKSDTQTGDYIRLRWADGKTNEGMVAGAMLGNNGDVFIVLTKGPKFKLTERDSIELITPAVLNRYSWP